MKIEVNKQDVDASIDGALTPKQLLFVEEFLVDLHGTNAAIRAGFSRRSARTTASRLLKNANIQHSIRHRMEFRIVEVRDRQQWVLDELIKLYYEANKMVPVSEGRYLWKNDSGLALKCLTLLGKHLGMFSGNSESQVTRFAIVDIPKNGREVKV